MYECTPVSQEVGDISCYMCKTTGQDWTFQTTAELKWDLKFKRMKSLLAENCSICGFKKISAEVLKELAIGQGRSTCWRPMHYAKMCAYKTKHRKAWGAKVRIAIHPFNAFENVKNNSRKDESAWSGIIWRTQR